MRWRIPIPLPEGLLRRSARYILQRYLGNFLEEKLTLDQLTFDVHNNVGSVSNVSLDVEALNELAEQHNLPVEFVDGSIAEFRVSIPWTRLFNDSSTVEINGLHLVVQPKQRADNGASMFDSMWSSMTSSIQLAEECLKNTLEQIPVEETNPVNGVEEFARAIDSILNRTKLKFIDTRIRLEHLPKDSVIGGALELHIKQFTYHDETSNETSDDSPTIPASAYGVKLFSAEGVELYTSEFQASHRTMSRSLLFESAMSLNASMTEPTERCPMSQDDMILFGKFLGKQEVRLKMKQKENASGPKTDLELNVSSFAILASPRQLRIVCETIAGLMSPHLQDTSNVKPHHRVNQKPMTASDYERVEHVLHQHLNPSSVSDVMVKSLQNASGWSSAGRGEESDDGFRPVRGHYASSTMSDSASTSFSSSYASTASSCYHSKLNEQFGYSHPRSHTSRHKYKSSGSESDFSGDIQRFEIRLNFLTVLLLHRDILVSSDRTRLPEETSVQEMKALSDSFFAHFVQSNLHGKPGRQPTIALDKNHFRLHCTTIILKGDEKSNLSNSEVSGSLSVAKLELLECLMELNNKKEEIIESIRFMNPADVASDASAFTRPDVVAHFKFSDDMKRFAAHKRAELNVMMRHCYTEIDVSTIDRMVDILSNLREFVTVLDKSTDVARPGLSDVHAPVVDSKADWKVSSPFIRVKLRFPIPELKDECNDEYWFWHRRNVHNDLLFVELSELTIHSEISSHQLAQTYEVQAKSVRILFQESTAEKPVPFVFSGVDEKVGAYLPNEGEGFDWPRLVLRVYPKVNYVELEDVEERMNTTRGMAQSIIQVEKKEPSPFSAKMVKRESDTSHSNATSESDGEEIILPGNKEEMGEFVEAASHNALLQVDLSLPSAVVVIPSKHFYELLYNRFSNDLMLWTPKASRQSHSLSDNQHSQNVHLNFGHAGSMFTSFSMCKSTLRADSESEDEDACGNLLDGEVEKSTQKADNKANDLSQSSITVSLFVGQGVVDIFPHARDTTGNVIPEQYGEIHVMFQEANLFFVSGYKGEPLLNYLCLQVNHSTLYHCSLVPGCTENTLKPIDAYPSKCMLPTIYKTQAGGVVNESADPVGTGSTISDDMLTLAIRVQGQENRVKNICVANSLNGVTIRHRMKVSYTSWLSQLIDFFDIKDYPISDYQPWKVVTQLHQQFLNCVIDYRPLYLPMKAALSVEDFNISSNITSKTATSILRFIAEEASLFISCKVSEDRDNPQDLALDLRNDYVCVVEMGLFELSMRLTEKDGECEPETDLRASNNIVHIRTCADSAVALMELVKYVAGDGDLSDAQFTDEYSRKGSSGSGDDLLVRIELDEAEENPHVPCMGVLNTSESCVPRLVEEAMLDVPYEEPPKKKINHLRSTKESNVEVFYFPNEDSVSVGSSYGPTFSDSLSSDEDLDNGYIYVDHDMDMGMGYVGQGNNAPEIRLLTKEPVRMVDNHFTVPINKVDVLKAPKGFPQPVSKYTLREMTIVWHMHGGNDFPKGDEDTKASDTKKHVVIAPERSGSSESLYSFDSGRTVKRKSTDSINIAYSATRSGEVPSVNFVSSPSPQYSYTDLTTISPTSLHERHKNCRWLVAGGVNRTHDELMELKFQKLKYQYELYPKDTKQASRQVLLAQEVEISDRMATSQINKFLYQYSSSARPKQSHANMIVIKATYIRPELNVSHRQECCLRVSMLPLRLNIDQDSLLFLINFFNEISGNKNEDDAATVNTAGSKTAQQPVLNIEKMDPGPSAEERLPPPMGAAPVSTPTFIRSFIFTQDVPIRLDYAGKRVDMSHGPLAGLIMGLGQLNCSELKLKRLCNRHGILGFDKLISYILSEWLNDIKKNQLPSILGGVGPMHSLVQLIQGVRDLFWLPIEQYQKDGRIVRGLQRGANSFTTSTAMAALELTARLVYAIQLIAETAFDLVSPGPSFRHRYGDRSGRNDFRTGFRNRNQYRYQRPGDFREGIVGAMQLMREGLGDTAHTLMRVASMENETKGAVGAVGGIIREMPSAALTPIILATQATSNVLDGVRSHLVPDARTEAALKWKTDYFD